MTLKQSNLGRAEHDFSAIFSVWETINLQDAGGRKRLFKRIHISTTAQLTPETELMVERKLSCNYLFHGFTWLKVAAMVEIKPMPHQTGFSIPLIRIHLHQKSHGLWYWHNPHLPRTCTSMCMTDCSTYTSTFQHIYFSGIHTGWKQQQISELLILRLEQA